MEQCHGEHGGLCKYLIHKIAMNYCMLYIYRLVSIALCSLHVKHDSFLLNNIYYSYMFTCTV